MRSMIAILAVFVVATPLWAQDSWSETRFHRIYLRNGNFIDGTVISDKPAEVVLKLKTGEMIIRRDLIEKVELVKMRSWNEKPTVIEAPKSNVSSPTGMDDRTQARTDTPEAIRKKVDMILFKYKQDQSPEKSIPYEEIGALGEDATVYLASRAPAFDLKSIDGIAAALINLNKVKVSDKVNKVLEEYLTHTNPAVRAFAASVLSEQGDSAREKYLRLMLQDKDARVRIGVLSSLGSVEDKQWFEPVLELCSDPEKDVRTRAYRLAKNLAAKHGLNEAMTARLALNMKSDNAEIRGESADLLGLMGAKDHWKALADALNDQEEKVRASAAQSLMNLIIPEATEAIISAIEREQGKTARTYLAGCAVKLRILKTVDTLISWLGEQDPDTKALAQASLTGVTGQNLGADPAAWTAWWAANKPK